MNNYSNGKVYQILCLETGERYIGSCVTTLTQRLHGHMQKNNRCSSRKIVERGNYNMLLLEDFPCSNKKELTTRERFYFDKLENVNIRRPVRLEEDKEAIAKSILGHTKVYRDSHKEESQAYRDGRKEVSQAYRDGRKEENRAYRDAHREESKAYCQANKEHIADIKRKYNAAHKDEIAEKKRLYYQANKETFNLKAKEYRQANLEMMRERDRLNRGEKYVCECGGRYTTRTKLKHTYTHKHIDYANAILESETVD